jgi:hypothetical protein
MSHAWHASSEDSIERESGAKPFPWELGSPRIFVTGHGTVMHAYLLMHGRCGMEFRGAKSWH